MSVNKVHGETFSVCFVASVVFDFDVKVEAALAPVNFQTRIVWTNERSINLFRCPSHMLLTLFLTPNLRLNVPQLLCRLRVLLNRLFYRFDVFRGFLKPSFYFSF